MLESNQRGLFSSRQISNLLHYLSGNLPIFATSLHGIWRKVEDSNPYAISGGSFQDCSRTNSGYLPLVPYPRFERGTLAGAGFKPAVYTCSTNMALTE